MSVFKDNILKGKVALITGGATGIGKQIAYTLGKHGASVCIASRKQERLQKTCEELQAKGIQCTWFSCDIREPEQVEDVIKQIIKRHKGLDIVINNAAGNFPAAIANTSYKGFKTITDIDLLGTYNVTRAAFDAWLKDNGGHIVNISAPFQNLGVSYQAHVAAAKAGVDSLTRSAAVEFGPHGIRVNAVCPGATADTEGLERFAAVSEELSTSSTCPLGYLGQKSDIANAVLFLVSDAASYINGQVFSVDGGSGIDMLKLGPIS